MIYNLTATIFWMLDHVYFIMSLVFHAKVASYRNGTTHHTETLTLADLVGACRAHTTPYGTQFFRFHIHFHRKAPASGVHVPPNGSTPPLQEILDPPLIEHISIEHISDIYGSQTALQCWISLGFYTVNSSLFSWQQLLLTIPSCMPKRFFGVPLFLPILALLTVFPSIAFLAFLLFFYLHFPPITQCTLGM